MLPPRPHRQAGEGLGPGRIREAGQRLHDDDDGGDDDLDALLASFDDGDGDEDNEDAADEDSDDDDMDAELAALLEDL